ncbi:T9SS type A sorting domain-containing protein [bacterium]|nr:T9SS type A sorting domain-containing protein [bacterium]
MLLPVGPNPSAGTLRLAYDLAAAGRVRLGVYDVAGRLVAKVVDGTMPAGSHAASWNGADRGGRQVASGVYFVRLEAAGASQTRRITVVR